jgi:hypothetical protein
MLGVLAIYLGLTDENSLAVTFWAAEEGEQQIQCWEAEDFDFRATTRASAGEKIQGTITIAIAHTNANATGEVFSISHEL